MIRSFLAGLALACMASCALAATACPQDFAGGIPPSAPQVHEQLCFTAYSLGYVPAWGEPAWSAEHLSPAQARAGAATKRFGNFHPEAQLPAAERVTPGDYDRTGYDRGHMVNALDHGADKPETFSMANMVPQKPALNRMIWAGIEAAVSAWAISGADIYVVNGPEVGPSAQKLNGKIAIPASTWKALYVVGQGAAAYDCTNDDKPVCQQWPISTLAAVIGFDPFPGLTPAQKVTIILPQPTKGGKLAN